MFRSGILLLGLVMIAGCKTKDKKQPDGFSYQEFSDRFSSAALPYQVSDTSLQHNRDTAVIRSAEFAAFIPDSLKTRWFGKASRPRYISQARFKGPKETNFYVIKAVSGNKRVALLAVFDKSEYRAVFPLLIPDGDATTSQWTVIDKSIGITRNISRKKDNVVTEGRDVYQYDAASRQFSLVLTNPLDAGPVELINPIDTFARRHKFSGDYGREKGNIISIRDGRYPNQLLVFIHLDKNKGECTGELKGDLLMTSSTTAVYRQSGDPCVMNFSFSGNSVTIKEDQGCGSRRGLDCTFDGTFARKAKTLKKSGANK